MTNKVLPPAAGMGRKKGVPNKTTALLKDAILKAAEGAGGPDGMVGYLQAQATANPGPFMAWRRCGTKAGAMRLHNRGLASSCHGGGPYVGRATAAKSRS